MKILAMDTSNITLTVAVLEDDKLLAQVTTNISRNHSTTLMPVIEAVLKQAKLTIHEIDRIAVAKGPGSYTGLRIAATTAKVLASTLKIELVGISSLKLLAANITDTDRIIIPMFDARRDNVFAGAYQWGKNGLVNYMEDQHISIQKLAERFQDEKVILVASDAAELYENVAKKMTRTEVKFASQKDSYPSAYVLGLLAHDEKTVDIDSFIPSYLRLTQAETQWLEEHDSERIEYVKKFNDKL